ncbi:hypothetical protein CUJ83_06925 [Methanocella sp. CWC-04]|uniref:Uncharacterized protein n=1 Tax=Methanooceanicella nereidis TaxID=2052831 RepID=A0AAP2RER7_9EURY|nr:hypothetical protein [Methanocella sp. CWC-04]MCD1294730.1 hypothetical protein [Methanocella sp. CWC-04]
MDGAGQTIFERIEYKLSQKGIEVDNSDLVEAARQIEQRLREDPADVDSKMIRIELKIVELARLLNATLDTLDATEVQNVSDDGAEPVASHPEEYSGSNEHGHLKYRLNSATGIIEQVEDKEEDEVIVADTRGRFGGKRDGKKEDKKCVFIAATDDESVKPSDLKKK